MRFCERLCYSCGSIASFVFHDGTVTNAAIQYLKKYGGVVGYAI